MDLYGNVVVVVVVSAFDYNKQQTHTFIAGLEFTNQENEMNN